MAIGTLAVIIMSASSVLGELRPNKEGRNFEGLIVEGFYADIKDFAYTASIQMHCVTPHKVDLQMYSCGSSILNEAILLTAAHCLNSCKKTSFIQVNVGSVDRSEGIQNSASAWVCHKKFSRVEMSNDLGLMKLKNTLNFGDNVQRVVLMRNQPRDIYAVVAGWGLTDEIKETRGNVLKFTIQRIWNRKNCLRVIRNLPKGTICAGEKKASGYASLGDSGGALVIKKNIQIGIVSFKIVDASRSLAVYTNVSYFYDWIKNNAKRLYY